VRFKLRWEPWLARRDDRETSVVGAGLPAIGNALYAWPWNIAVGAGFKPAPTVGLIMRGNRPWRTAASVPIAPEAS